MSHRTIHIGRFGIGLGAACGAVTAVGLVGLPFAHADVYELDPVGPATILSDEGIPGWFAYGQVAQQIAEIDATTGEVATGAQAGSLDVTENIFTSPFGSVAFIDGADATNGSGMYAADAGDPSYWALDFNNGALGFGNIPLNQFDYSTLFGNLGDTAAATPADDFGFGSLMDDLMSWLNLL